MDQETLKLILKEQKKTNELLQVIASNSEQMIPAEVKIASYIAEKIMDEAANQDEDIY
ncbi:hypothetical protein G15_2047 [Enterococcus avium]|nr:hypothetical protein G15_2047 [Enterococcus avium]